MYSDLFRYRLLECQKEQLQHWDQCQLPEKAKQDKAEPDSGPVSSKPIMLPTESSSIQVDSFIAMELGIKKLIPELLPPLDFYLAKN